LDTRLITDRFPRSNQYHPEWVLAAASSGANTLWITEWLASAMDLKPGMRVLDLGCGRAMSSIFLRREFGVQVWATDLWFSPSENRQRIADAGPDVADGVFPIHSDARLLPFATEFFDAIVSIDSFPYYGTDDNYLNYLARFVKPGGAIGIAGAGLLREFDGPVPDALKAWWEPNMVCLHSADWWRRHWERTGILDIELAHSMDEGWRLWLQWQLVVAPENLVEIRAVEADQGNWLGYLRVIGRRRADAKLDEPITALPAKYVPQPLLRNSHPTGKLK
jgi:cyclopropane fatty-acyl-phospholipid synthase-like methyltransferase